MNVNHSEIEKKTVSVSNYINSLEQPFQEKFLTRKRTYQLKQDIINQLRKYAGNTVIVAFSAEWCKDCIANIPVLALISETARIDVRIFGGLKKDSLNSERKWRIPPSPPEVETFNIDKIPLILLFDEKGNEIGRIVENPKEPTLERELLKIILAKSK
jgi:thiol-disulfide isomerase/thioredoxin